MPAAVACTVSTAGLLEAVTALVGLGLTSATFKAVSNGAIATLSGRLRRPADAIATINGITSITEGSAALNLAQVKAVLAAVPSGEATVAVAFYASTASAPAYLTVTYGSSPQRAFTLPNLSAET